MTKEVIFELVDGTIISKNSCRRPVDAKEEEMVRNVMAVSR
jgi:hypothetical protein